jgi:hypothetical protein
MRKSSVDFGEIGTPSILKNSFNLDNLEKYQLHCSSLVMGKQLTL